MEGRLELLGPTHTTQVISSPNPIVLCLEFKIRQLQQRTCTRRVQRTVNSRRRRSGFFPEALFCGSWESQVFIESSDDASSAGGGGSTRALAFPFPGPRFAGSGDVGEVGLLLLLPLHLMTLVAPSPSSADWVRAPRSH